MKKLLFLFFILASFNGFSQFASNPQQGNAGWNNKFLGGVSSAYGFGIPYFADSAAANALAVPQNIKGIPGWTINIGGYIHVRNQAATKWEIQNGGAPVTTNANLTGDVTSVGNATTIATNAVTLAKFQQIATNSLLGRSTAATGNVEVITVGSGLTLSAGTLTATGSGGDMILASAQTNTGAKTFLDGTMLLRNVANTFNGSFTNTNTAARIYTLKDAAGTVAFTSLRFFKITGSSPCFAGERGRVS